MDDVTLCATPWKALEALDQDPVSTILTTTTANGPLYAVGRWPAVAIGHADWTQTCPEALEALRA